MRKIDLLDRYIKGNQLKIGAALSYLSIGLGYVISIIYTPIMLKLLGQSEYGLYNLVSSVVSYLGLLNFGFTSAYMRYYSKYKVDKNDKEISKINGMFLVIFSTLSVIAVVAGGILVLNIEILLGNNLNYGELKIAKILMVILVINIALSFPFTIFSSHITANEEFFFQKIIYLVKVVISPFITLPFLLMGYGSIGMVAISTIITITIEIINLIFCMHKLKMKFTFRQFDMKLMKEMTIFSSFIFINMIVDQINWNVDKFILGRLNGTVSVAIYGLGMQLSMYYKSLSTVISSVFVPKVNKLVHMGDKEDELNNLFVKIGRIQFIILSLICSGLIFFGKPFISMWAGKEYIESYGVTLLLVTSLTIPCIQNIGIEIQRAKDMHKFRSLLYLIIAIGNILISIPLCKLYGAKGAAMGTTISMIIGNGILMNWYYHKKVKINILIFWRNILSISKSLLIPIAFGILIIKYINLYNIYKFIICGVIYIGIFLINIWFIGMNEFEKNLFIKPTIILINKLKSKRKIYEKMHINK